MAAGGVMVYWHVEKNATCILRSFPQSPPQLLKMFIDYYLLCGKIEGGGDEMLIQVLYPDNHYDYVNDHMLNDLIKSKAIISFKRSSGWVTVGTEPVRQFNRGFHPKENTYQNSGVEVKNSVRVVYTDGRYDYVLNSMLDNLLALNKISSFS